MPRGTMSCILSYGRDGRTSIGLRELRHRNFHSAVFRSPSRKLRCHERARKAAHLTHLMRDHNVNRLLDRLRVMQHFSKGGSESARAHQQARASQQDSAPAPISLDENAFHCSTATDYFVIPFNMSSLRAVCSTDSRPTPIEIPIPGWQRLARRDERTDALARCACDVAQLCLHSIATRRSAYLWHYVHVFSETEKADEAAVVGVAPLVRNAGRGFYERGSDWTPSSGSTRRRSSIARASKCRTSRCSI